MIVPDEVVDSMTLRQRPQGGRPPLCMEQIEHLKSIEGVHGVHIMAVAWEEEVPQIVRDAGLLPRPGADL